MSHNCISVFSNHPKYKVWIGFGIDLQMVEEKARFNNNPTNFAVAKTLLMKEKDMAQQKGDEDVSVRDECIMIEVGNMLNKENRKKKKSTLISYFNMFFSLWKYLYRN